MMQSRRDKALMDVLEAARTGKATADHYVDTARRFDAEEEAHGAALSEALGVEMSSRVDGTGRITAIGMTKMALRASMCIRHAIYGTAIICR